MAPPVFPFLVLAVVLFVVVRLLIVTFLILLLLVISALFGGFLKIAAILLLRLLTHIATNSDLAFAAVAAAFTVAVAAVGLFFEFFLLGL